MQIFTIRNENGLKAEVSNYGGRIMKLFTPDREGNFSDIVLGYDDIEGYLNSNEAYFGAAIGRYGNRIGNARFSIDGKENIFTDNNGKNSLHGGNFLNGSDVGKNSIVYNYRTAFCLETQHFPDSPNKAEFPSTLLEPGEEYYSVCIYRFLS